MINARTVAAALDGQVAGPNTVLAPGPGHSMDDRSLAVRLDPRAPDGFLIFSHAGDDWRKSRDHVRAVLKLPPWQPGDGQRRIKTQTILPSAETAAMLFWALLAAGQITMRKVDGWQTLSHKLADTPIDLAA